MNPATQYIFPGALLGSIGLAFFAFTVTSGMTLPANFSTSQAIPDLAKTTDLSAGSITPEEGSSVEENGDENEEILTDDNEAKNEAGSDCQVSKNYPNKILNWCNQITRFSDKNDLDPDLVAALILQESGGNPSAYSKSGAVGLMQVMPRDGLAASFSCVNGPCFANRPSIKQLEDPKFNIQYGTNMLAGLVDKHGDVREALKSYGPMNVGYYYADIVLKIYKNYRD